MKISNYKILEVYKNSGTSQKTGEEWHSTEILIANDEGFFENKMLVRLMPKCAESFNFEKGDFIDLEVEFTTREFNGNFYNTISTWKVTKSNKE